MARLLSVAPALVFMIFFAAMSSLSTPIQSLLTVCWISYAPDHIEDTILERILFKFNDFEYNNHRWLALPNTSLLNWYNSEVSYKQLSKIQKPYKYFYKHDVQSRFYIYGMLWSYGSISCFNECMSYLVSQSSTKLTMPIHILAAQYDGYWQGKTI